MTGTICADQPTTAPVRAGRREWLGLAVLALPTILIGLDGTVLHLAAPVLSADLAPSSSQLLWIVDVYGFRPGMAMSLGFLTAVPGLALMAVSGRWPVVVGLALTSLGIQIVLALTYDVVVSSAPPERAGVASGMGETGSELGIALGIAIAGSLVTAVYRAGVSVPAGAPDSVRDTLGGAVAAAEHLPGPVADRLLETARDSYTNGVQLSALVSAAMVVILAAATAKLVRTE